MLLDFQFVYLRAVLSHVQFLETPGTANPQDALFTESSGQELVTSVDSKRCVGISGFQHAKWRLKDIQE